MQVDETTFQALGSSIIFLCDITGTSLYVQGDSSIDNVYSIFTDSIDYLSGIHNVDATVVGETYLNDCLITGSGIFNAVFVQFDSILYPTETITMNSLSGSFPITFYSDIVDGIDFGQLRIDDLFEFSGEFIIDAEYTGLSNLNEGDYLPLVLSSSSFPFNFVDTLLNPIVEYDIYAIPRDSNSSIASYLVPFVSLNAFSLHINTPPTTSPNTCLNSCEETTICTCCVNVIVDDFDVDPLDSIGLETVSFTTPGPEPSFTDFLGNVCVEILMDGSGDRNFTFEYEAIDTVGGISSLEIITFNLLELPCYSCPSDTPSTSVSASNSESRSPTQTRTPSRTPSPTISLTSSRSSSSSQTTTPTATKTPSSTGTGTATQTSTPSPSTTITSTPTVTPTPSLSESNTPSITRTSSSTPTISLSSSKSNTQSISESRTTSPSPSGSISNSKTSSNSISISNSLSLTPSISESSTSSKTISLSSSNSNTPSSSVSSSKTPSSSISISSSNTPSISISSTPEESKSPSKTPTSSKSLSNSETRTRTPTRSRTSSISESKSASSSYSNTKSSSPSLSSSSSISISNSESISSSLSNSITLSSSITPSLSSSESVEPSLSSSTSISISLSNTPSISISSSSTNSPSPSMSRTPSSSYFEELVIGPPSESNIPIPSISSTRSTTVSSSVSISLNEASLFFGQISGNSSEPITSQVRNICSTCDFGDVDTVIDTTNENKNVDLVTNTNNIVGSVFVPQNVIGNNNNNNNGDTTVKISFVTNFPQSDEVGDVIVDITLFDSQGNQITQLDEKVEICLSDSSANKVRKEKKKKFILILYLFIYFYFYLF